MSEANIKLLPRGPSQEAEGATENGRPDCVHHWLIEPPNGPTSMGQCRRCGAVKVFSNQPTAEVLHYEEDVAA